MKVTMSKNTTRIALMLIIAACLMLAYGLANAQTPANTATLTWSAVTWPGGPVTYNVYQGLKGQPKTKGPNVSTTTATINTGLATGSEYCWHVTAVGVSTSGTQESMPSNEACKMFPWPLPAAPANLVAN